MKRILIIVMVISMTLAFCSCGSDEAAEPTAYSPTDIQVEATDDGNIFYVIYDIENEDKEQWHGYDSYDNEVQTAINGIKECMSRDDWTDNSCVRGYAGDTDLSHTIYTYGADYDYSKIDLYQIGIYNDSYVLQGELDQ